MQTSEWFSCEDQPHEGNCLASPLIPLWPQLWPLSHENGDVEQNAMATTTVLLGTALASPGWLLLMHPHQPQWFLVAFAYVVVVIGVVVCCNCCCCC